MRRYLNKRNLLKIKEKELKNNIISFMGSNEIGTSNKYSVSYKSQKSTSVDTATLKKELPDIYNKYIKTSETKVLRIKTI